MYRKFIVDKNTLFLEIILEVSLKASRAVPRLPPAVFWAQKTPHFYLKARCEVPRLPPAVFLGPQNTPFFFKSQV
jgi:hypothetical protein